MASSSKYVLECDHLRLHKILPATHNHVKKYMSNYDSSHDFNHIVRVLNLSIQLASVEEKRLGTPTYDRNILILAALLHDVGDKKYSPADSAATAVAAFLTSEECGASESLADAVQQICSHVSYSAEIKDPGVVLEVIKEYPELAVVQDADRLDAIGAVGIGRTFTYGGAKNTSGPGMENTIRHFEEKLMFLERMMKTEAGKAAAKVRAQRIREFERWWREEKMLGGDIGQEEIDDESPEMEIELR